jgi:hypothetical protein
MYQLVHRRARMKDTTRATWAARIEEWRRSGKTAKEFAEGHPFSGGTLTWRASQLKREGGVRSKRRVSSVRSSRARSKVVFAEVVRRSLPAQSAALMVEVGGARVSVSAGCDSALLRDVLLALREEQS